MSSDGFLLEDPRICFVDGIWKAKDRFVGQGWFCRTNGSTEKMMGTMNLLKSLSVYMLNVKS